MIGRDSGIGSDGVLTDKFGVKELIEKGLWKPHWTIERVEFKEENRAEAEAFAAAGHSFEETLAKFGGKRLETSEIDGNILVNAGINLMENLLIGAGGTVFSNANAYLGVGDSTTAAAATQTDLQAATNKLRKAMNATYPTQGSQVLTFQSDFGSTDANFHWQEMATFNASTSGTMLNRLVSDQGTKTSDQTWRLTLTVTIS